MSSDPVLGLKGNIDIEKIVPIQWGSDGLIGNPDINLKGIPLEDSIADIDEIFSGQPEWAAYVRDNYPNKEDEYQFTSANSQRLLYEYDTTKASITTNTKFYTTFLNPDSMRSFYVGVSTGDIDMLSNRFRFQNIEQAQIFREYLDYLVVSFMNRDASYEIIALASLTYSAQARSLALLQDNLPTNTTTRVVASMNMASGNDCSYFVIQAGVDKADAPAACEQYADFTDPVTLYNVITACLDGSSVQATDFLANTGMNPF